MRSRNRHELVDVIGLGPLPGGMALGSAALFLLAGGRVGGWRGERVAAAFELAAVQGLKLGLEVLMFPFQFSLAAVGLVQFLVELLDDMLVMALGAGHRLIAVPDHVSGQAFQVGAAIPIGAVEGVVQFAEARHGSVGGG